jgi:hypothetical protein
MAATTIFQHGTMAVSDYRCTAGPDDMPFAEAHRCHSISYVRKGSFACCSRGRTHELVAGSFLIGHPGDEYICRHDHHGGGDECLAIFLAPEMVESIGDGRDIWQRGAVAPLAELMVLGELARPPPTAAATSASTRSATRLRCGSSTRYRAGRHRGYRPAHGAAAAPWRPRCGSTPIRRIRSTWRTPRARQA